MRFILVLTAFLLAVSMPSNAYAFEAHAESSAKLTSTFLPTGTGIPDTRVKAAQTVLKKYNSPLASYATYYIKYADMYDVDWKLLPSIAGLESTFGRFFVKGSYNAYGWGGGYIYFESWEDGIRTINKALRQNYMDKWGAKSVWQIGPFYAESPTWAARVSYFMNEFDKEYNNTRTLALNL